MRIVAVGIAALLVGGCVTDLVRGAESVRITTNADVVKACKYIGAVRAKDRMNGGVLGEDTARENTDRRLKNQAAEMGANVVHLQMADYGYFGASGQGEAYLCPEQ